MFAQITQLFFLTLIVDGSKSYVNISHSCSVNTMWMVYMISVGLGGAIRSVTSLVSAPLNYHFLVIFSLVNLLVRYDKLHCLL